MISQESPYWANNMFGEPIGAKAYDEHGLPYVVRSDCA